MVLFYEDEKVKIYHGDCLEEVNNIEQGSVDLVLIDPPYGAMKTKKSVAPEGSYSFKAALYEKYQWDIAIPPKELFNITAKVLRKNGRFITFSQQPYTTQLISNQIALMPYNYSLTWLKNCYGNVLYCKKAPVSYTEDILVFTKEYCTLDNELKQYSKKVYDYIGKTQGKIAKVLKSRKAEHFFYFDSTQHELCTEETYQDLIKFFNIDKMDGFLSYERLKELQKIPVFNLPDGKKTKSNVLEYKKEGNNKYKYHPTQKPVPLLEDLIKTYSNEGDLVLDFTMGSGSTLIAAMKVRRRCIGVEQDLKFCDIAYERMNEQR